MKTLRLVCGSVILGFCLGWGVHPAEASFISIRASATSQIISNQIESTLGLVNQGDEPAHGIRIEAWLDKAKVVGTNHPPLPPEESLSETFLLGAVPAKEGLYHTFYKIHYADANGYPFSALAFNPISIGNPANSLPKALVHMNPLALSNKGTLTLRLKSLAQTPRDFNIHLILPDELTCEIPEANLILEPGRTKEIEFALENFSGRPGSSYSILALVVSEDSESVSSQVTSGIIGIEAPQPVFKRHAVGWAVVIALLILAGVAAQLIRPKQKM